DARVLHEHVDGERAVVRRRLALVGPLRELPRTPRPREHRSGAQIPVARRPRGLDAHSARHGAEESDPALLRDLVDGATGVLARLPAGGELPWRGGLEVLQRHAITLRRRRAL